MLTDSYGHFLTLSTLSCNSARPSAYKLKKTAVERQTQRVTNRLNYISGVIKVTGVDRLAEMKASWPPRAWLAALSSLWTQPGAAAAQQAHTAQAHTAQAHTAQ